MTGVGVARESLAAVRDLAIDQQYLRDTVEALSGIGSTPLGFRTTGTPEDAAVADHVAEQMRAIGLVDVEIEEVPVDAWRLLGAWIEVGDTRYDGSSFGGVTPTPPGGVQGPLVDAGRARRRELDCVDVRGAVVLVDWWDVHVSPYVVALELTERGAVGMVLTCPPGGPWYQSPDALGSFDGHWPSGGVPMVFVRKEDAARIRATIAGSPTTATLVLDAELSLDAAGHNVVGYLRGERPGPVVVGAHHDGWFHGAFDDASGVAALLALAKALAERGHQLPYTVCFTTRTAEEYGITDSSYDWCIGAWQQVHTTHPEWATQAPFHLVVEANGRPGIRAIVEAPVELATWARRVCRAADAEGWLPTGWRMGPPVSGTEQWPFLVSGVPGVATYYWETSFGRTDYHTQLDVTDGLDFGYVEAQVRVYALLLLEAMRDPDALIDHRARGRQLSQRAAKLGASGDELSTAASGHAPDGRAGFTAVGRGLFALDAGGALSYPHEQAAHDVAALTAALDALDAGDPATARRQLGKVGGHRLFPYLSEPAFARRAARDSDAAVGRSWAVNSHVTASPTLWAELATLHGETGARPDGPWLRAGIADALDRSRDDLDRRLHDMADLLTRSPSADS